MAKDTMPERSSTLLLIEVTVLLRCSNYVCLKQNQRAVNAVGCLVLSSRLWKVPTACSFAYAPPQIVPLPRFQAFWVAGLM